MAFLINAHEVPGLISWFNNFVGYREIQKRVERVDFKLRDIGVPVPALDRRYFFHRKYLALAKRNRLYGKIDLSDPLNARIVGFLAAIRDLSALLDDGQRKQLRSRIIESLDPDRDVRELEHELRVFVHYRSAGLKIVPGDTNQERFDFLVHAESGEFEIECKTFSESIGNSISIEDSIHAFRAFKAALNKSPNFVENGLLTLTVPRRIEMPEEEITEIIRTFLSDAPKERHADTYILKFHRKPEWDELLRQRDRESILQQAATKFLDDNFHTVISISKSHAVVFALDSHCRPRPINAICSRLKKASEQFSGNRPAMIWGHFLGIDNDEFAELLQRRKIDRPLFDVFGHYIFKEPRRSHVCRLRLSAEGNPRAMHQSRTGLLLPISISSSGGPAYDLTSHVSKFDFNLTQ